VAPTGLTVTQNDRSLNSFKWHSDLSGKSHKWHRENEGCVVLPPAVALLQSSQLLLCNVVLVWQSTPSLDAWTAGTILQGGLAAGDVLSHEGWDRKQLLPGAFLWNSWLCQCHTMLLGTAQRNAAWRTVRLPILRADGNPGLHQATRVLHTLQA